MALVLAVAVSAGMTLFGVENANAAITDAFTIAYQTNEHGSIVLRGNASLTCSGAGCATALDGSATGTALNNNSYVMTNVDVDSDAATFNSSTTSLALPTNSTVLFAGLYWGADTSVGASGTAAPNAAARNQVLFSAPGAAYATVTASQLSTPVAGSGAYQSFAEVTSQVLAGGNGTYAVGNIQSGTGQDRYAGWSLVIAYENPVERNRNMVIYDGFGFVRNTAGQTSLNIPVSGFQTPASGSVTTRIGTVVYEGDRGFNGDTLQLNSVPLTDGQNPVDNFFNSTQSDGGSGVTTRNPAPDNMLGVDIDQFDASGKLANGATSATLTLNTTTETFYPGVVTFSTDLYGPLLNTAVTGTDVDGGNLLPGDIVEYTFTVRNDGTDDSIKSILTDAVPTQTTYVPGSLVIAGAPVTDAAADDTGEMVSRMGTFRIGTGATLSAGGEVAHGATTTVTYRVRVDLDTPAGFKILNSGNLTYQGKFSGSAESNATASNALTVLRPTADLRVTGSVAPSTVQHDLVDDPVTYTLTAVNNGPEQEPAATATLTLAAGVTAGTLPGGCSVVGQVVTCALGAIPSGGSVVRSVPATVDATAAFSSPASAHVSGTGSDPTPANNTATVALVVNTAPTAQADTAATTDGVATLVDVLVNDSDPDAGDTLHTTAVGTPAHGTTMIEPDGRVRYTPTTGYGGADAFTYTVSDDHGGSTTVSVGVTVTITNVAPVATDDSTATQRDTDVPVPVLGNDTDANGDTLSVTAATDGTHGTVTHTGSDVTYHPAAGFTGVDTFTYTVDDGNGGTDTATVTVTVNGPPAASADVLSTGYDVTTAATDVRGNDTDPNGDPLTITAASQGSHGAVTFTGTTVTYDPAAGFSGVDTFTYTVSDGHGGTATATVSVTVANAPPVAADRTATTTHHQAVPVTLLTGAADPNGDTMTVTGVTTPGHGVVVRSGGTATYTPDTGFAGTDTFDFTIDDGHGGTDTGTVTVTVSNAAPVAAPDILAVQIDHPATVAVLANDTDVNGDALTVTILTAPAHGSTTINPDRTVTYLPDHGYAGTDTFTYQVSDPGGAVDTAPVSISVTNNAPTAHPDAGVAQPGSALTLPVTANDTDPGGDPLTVSAFTQGGHGTVTVDATNTLLTYTPAAGYAGSDTYTYTVTDGYGGFSPATVTVTVLNAPPVATDDTRRVDADAPTSFAVLTNDTDPNPGQTLDVQAVTQPAHGTVVVNPNGTVTYTPTTGYHGPDSFTYTARDGAGGVSNTATVTLAVDGKPVAVADTAATDTGAPVTITVLGNDTDPEGGALTVAGHTDPPHGMVVQHADGTFTYTPDAGWSGTDTFTYHVQDPNGGHSGNATVTVTVRNAVPVPGTDVASTGQGAARDIDVLGNDTDPNTGQTLTITAVTQPAHGSTSIVAGKVRYTPADTYKGTDTFTYTVGDGNGGTATGTVTVTVSDGAPEATDDSTTTGQDTAVTVDVLANDTDPNDDALSVVAVTQPAQGTVQVSASKQSLVYTPPAGFAGTVTFQYVVEDPDGTRDTATVTIVVIGAAVGPTVLDDDPGVTTGGTTDIDVLANDAAGSPGVTLTLDSVTQPQHGTVSIVAGKVRYTPDPGYAGTDTFTYTVSDGNGGTATGTVTVTVTADEPASDAAPSASDDARVTPYRTPVTVDVLGNDMDSDGDALTVTAVTQPAHGTVTISASAKAVVYTPPAGFSGVVTFSYTVDDGNGGTDTAEVTVTVGAAPAVPNETAHAKPGTPVRITLPTVDKNNHPVTVVGLGSPKHGTAALNADGTVTYTPKDGFVGTDTFTYTVTDANGALATGTVTVTVQPQGAKPVADDDTAATGVGEAVVVKVLDGDTDPDGDTLTVTGATKPRHGSVSINPDGTVTYVPDAGYSGPDSFTYTVDDGNGHTDTATVTLTVAAGGAGGSLPLTGASILSAAGIGLVVIVAGAALVAFGTRGGDRLAGVAAVLQGRDPAAPAAAHRHRRTHRRS